VIDRVQNQPLVMRIGRQVRVVEDRLAHGEPCLPVPAAFLAQIVTESQQDPARRSPRPTNRPARKRCTDRPGGPGSRRAGRAPVHRCPSRAPRRWACCPHRSHTSPGPRQASSPVTSARPPNGSMSSSTVRRGTRPGSTKPTMAQASPRSTSRTASNPCCVPGSEPSVVGVETAPRGRCAPARRTGPGRLP